MKKESPLWSSISLLIGIVIAILALIRGRMLLPLLLAVFALWLLWWLLTQALPLWRNNRAYRAKEARLREQTAAANGGGQLADALLCHVNYRITAMLHAAYPNARWEWLADKPSRFAVEGGTARIRVYGIPDFDYADVKLDQKANLDCSLVKLSPLVAGATDTQPPNRQPVNPRVWFETRGRAVLEALVTDLNSRGHSSLTVQENGEVFVQAKENEAEPAKETFLDFPEKVYWPQLVKVLEEEGYAADARDADKKLPNLKGYEQMKEKLLSLPGGEQYSLHGACQDNWIYALNFGKETVQVIDTSEWMGRSYELIAVLYTHKPTGFQFTNYCIRPAGIISSSSRHDLLLYDWAEHQAGADSY